MVNRFHHSIERSFCSSFIYWFCQCLDKCFISQQISPFIEGSCCSLLYLLILPMSRQVLHSSTDFTIHRGFMLFPFLFTDFANVQTSVLLVNHFGLLWYGLILLLMNIYWDGTFQCRCIWTSPVKKSVLFYIESNMENKNKVDISQGNGIYPPVIQNIWKWNWIKLNKIIKKWFTKKFKIKSPINISLPTIHLRWLIVEIHISFLSSGLAFCGKCQETWLIFTIEYHFHI